MSIVDGQMWVGAGYPWNEPLAASSAANPSVRKIEYKPDQVLAECDRAGIDRACIMPARNYEYEAANRYVAKLCESHRDRFIGVAAHSPQREQGRIREMLTREVQSMGMKAVRSDGAPTRELLDTAGSLGIPVIYYPDMQSTQGPAQFFHMPAWAYPDVVLILPYLGKYGSSWWVHLEAIDLTKRYPNVYVDTAAILEPKLLLQAAQELPAEKILFASAAPHLDARVAKETIRLLHLSEESQRKVMGGNLRRLLKI